MAKLSGNTIVTHPDTGAPTVLLEGSDVPDWAEGLIGDHLIEGKADEVERPAGDSSQEAWAKYAVDSQQATESEVEGLSRDELRELYG